MNKIIRYLIPLLLLESSLIAQEVLTVDSVVQMVKAGFSEKIILQRVRINPGHYGLTTQKMVELKRSGVPVSVLSEMLEKDQQNQSQIEESKPTADSCRAASRDWVTTSGQDSLTGAPFVAAEKVLSVGSGSCVRVTASCKSDTTMERLNESPLAAANPMENLIGSMGMAPPGYSPDKQPRTHFDTRTLNFVLQYVPAPRSGLSLLASPMKQTLTTYGNNPVGYVSPPSACVRLRVMVDDTGREGVASDRCNVQNLASISFPAARLSDAFASMSSPRSGGNAEMNTFVSKLMGQVYSAADQTVATMQQALVSQQIRIELPLTDGSSTIVTIQPREPAFQSFVTSCLSTFPDPPPPEVIARQGNALGVSVAPDTIQIPSRTKVPITVHGLRVTKVYRGNLLQVGDLITTVNGQTVVSEEDFAQALAHKIQSAFGYDFDVSVRRNGEIMGFGMSR